MIYNNNNNNNNNKDTRASGKLPSPAMLSNFQYRASEMQLADFYSYKLLTSNLGYVCPQLWELQACSCQLFQMSSLKVTRRTVLHFGLKC